MGKVNGKKRWLQVEHATGLGVPNPFIHTPVPHWSWSWTSSVVTLPGKPPHRICKGKP